MPATILSPSRLVERVEYCLSFNRVSDPNSGFSFPCDAQGNVLGDQHRTQAARQAHVAELREAVARGEFFAPEIETRRWTYREPAIAKCEACGRKVQLSDSLDNECDCGALYNLFGQRLRPRDPELEAEEFSYRDDEDRW